MTDSREMMAALKTIEDSRYHRAHLVVGMKRRRNPFLRLGTERSIVGLANPTAPVGAEPSSGAYAVDNFAISLMNGTGNVNVAEKVAGNLKRVKRARRACRREELSG